MKKTFLLFITVFIFSNLIAQPTTTAVVAPSKEQKVNLAIVGGTGLMWAGAVDKDRVTSDGLKALFNYGLSIDINMGTNYALNTGIIHRMAGANVNYLDDSNYFHSFLNTDTSKAGTYEKFYTNTLVKYKLQYVEIPLVLKLKTNEIGYSTYFMEFGVTPSINVKATGSIKTTSGGNDKTEKNLSKDVNLFNFGLTIGAGMQYALSGNTKLLAFIQFNNGFLDFTTDYKDTNNNAKAILRNLSLGVGIGF